MSEKPHSLICKRLPYAKPGEMVHGETLYPRHANYPLSVAP
jgi:hypothetical protein